MTYSVDGTLYVTVASGANRGGAATPNGDAVWTLSLNGAVGPVAAPKAPDAKVALGWNTGGIPGRQSASITFDKAGTWLYNCTPHPWMLGEIAVQ
jgi:hypothetical protein